MHIVWHLVCMFKVIHCFLYEHQTGNCVSYQRVILSIYNLYFTTCHPIFEEKWGKVSGRKVNISVQSHYSEPTYVWPPLVRNIDLIYDQNRTKLRPVTAVHRWHM